MNIKNLKEIFAGFIRSRAMGRHFRRLAVLDSYAGTGEHDEHHLLICKGAVEEILSVCSHVRHGDAVEPLTPELLERVRAITAEQNEDSLRVVAVASKEMPPTQEIYGVSDEAGLTLIGYVAFLDPPKESTEPALKALAAHGVAVKVLTGDNELVGVCDSVGSFWSTAFTASTVPPVPAQSSAIILRLKTSVSPAAVVARHWLALDGLEIVAMESLGKKGSRHPRVRRVCGL